MATASAPEHGTLKRSLRNRHIQLIALGGAIGTGLFLGTAGVIQSAGPAMILGYLIGGIIELLIMRQLSEMMVEEPVAGSFSHFAKKYWGDFAGFLSGWNYWILYVLVSMAELTAVGKYVQFWWPEFPTWATAVIFFLLINAINFANVKWFGEMESLFSIIKVIAVICFIVGGTWLLISSLGGAQASITNLWSHGGFFPHGVSGLVMALPIIMFSFGGLELVGISAAETADPAKTIPKATNQVIWRISLFYIGALVIMLSLIPWDQLVASLKSVGADASSADKYATSPFVQVFSMMHINAAAHIINFVVLTAALSVYNSAVYCNSRMLYGLALQGNAPRYLVAVNKRGVPVITLMVSGAMTVLCMVLNYVMPARAMELLFSLVVASLVINWAMISVTGLRFRSALNRQGRVPAFKSILFPYGNYLSIAFVVFILVIMLLIPGLRLSVYAIPIWIGALGIGYLLKQKFTA